MGSLATYQETVKRILTDYARLKPSLGDIEVEVLFDDVRGHYVMMYVGWQGNRRVHGSVIHVDIRNGKVWIQFDGTEDGIAEELVQAGIPREHIVLGFHGPEMRKHTLYAIS
jgi:hypothetical protein